MNLKFDEVLKTKKGGKVARVNQLDVNRARKHFADYEGKLEEMADKADAFEVTDEQSAQLATTYMAQATALKKEIDNLRKTVIAEAKTFFDSVNTFVRPFTSSLDKIIGGLKTKFGDYQLDVEMKRREEEKRAQDAAAKKQAEIDKAAKKAGIDPVTMPKPVLPKKQGPTRTGFGSASTRTKKYFEVTDFSKLPDEYKSINTKALTAAVTAGIREIPGATLKEKAIVSVRGS